VNDSTHFQFGRVAGHAVARLRGDIDLSNAATIKRSIVESISNHEHKVVVDLEQVEYLDSAGIGMLFDLWRRLTVHEQELILVVPAGSPVLRSLQVSGWPTDIKAVETLQEATEVAP
jgi:anti-sigma B factor antagonist